MEAIIIWKGSESKKALPNYRMSGRTEENYEKKNLSVTIIDVPVDIRT
jgi:hypothetical protein